MLLCGIINELTAKTDLLVYFFCQATDSRINSATAVLRGLLYLLIDQQPSLVSHIRKKYDHAGKALFEDANSWVVLSEIFINILQDPSLNSTYFIIDALDECVTDLLKLLDFIVHRSSSHGKWIVSSRNEAHIEQRLRLDDSGTRLSLELKENAMQVSRAVDAYIDYCLSELTQIRHNNLLRESVRENMQRKANGTFLWVSLVIRELKEALSWEVLQVLDEVPVELKDVYRRMMSRIKGLWRQRSELCRQVLSIIIAAYRPLHLQELNVLSSLPTQVQNINQSTTEIVRMCGSFLTIQNNKVYLIHQSAKDFLSEEASPGIFPRGIGDAHQSIFTRSLQVMTRKLQRDMDIPSEQVEQPDSDPLAASRYSCIYWIDHLCDWSHNSSTDYSVNLQDGGAVDNFIRKKYLYWLEALSLNKSMSKGVISMAKLEALVQGRADASTLIEVVRDARRFIMSHKWAIENSPLQAYVSALVFSPTRSLIRDLFKREEPDWITIKPAMEDKWSPCLQTLEGHSDYVRSVAFSHDSARLASASSDSTVKVWDASSGECLQTLSIGKALNTISFDITDSYLHTEIGIINISAPSSLFTLPTGSEPYNPKYQSLALSSDGIWITYDSENLVWLPSEYRPSCSAVLEKTIGIGVGTGRVWICKVHSDTS
ncbi:hypothetical protein K469DRAFT_2455 [Zopfia rhizophila CBS 207.26]|uniref:Uncharacterized protein n=1 Tax=Zopfia rhizophila CBS 207.26 TaxID=1314779 RepID=A0A6A6EUZ1_9PEZI|nr:hypothetical protein K469DRAFT_2455 [Zopfia rhizophila CBS 207.26]